MCSARKVGPLISEVCQLEATPPFVRFSYLSVFWLLAQGIFYTGGGWCFCAPSGYMKEDTDWRRLEEESAKWADTLIAQAGRTGQRPPGGKTAPFALDYPPQEYPAQMTLAL